MLERLENDMSKQIYILRLILIGLCFTFVSGCRNEDNPLPIEITTSETIAISSTRVKSGGTVSTDGGSAIIERGICYSLKPNPNITDMKMNEGSGIGSFEIYLSDLQTNTLYYIKSFGTNSNGTYYGNEKSVKTMEKIVDVDGNYYDIAIIGTQVWMAENLKTTKFNDGTPISPYNQSQSLSGWFWDNASNKGYKDTYGSLYNYYAVKSGKLCPAGWHIPTVEEWKTLINYNGGFSSSLTSDNLKEAGTDHWTSPNIGASNISGFTALPGGFLNQSEGIVHDIGKRSSWWNMAPITGVDWGWGLYNDSNSINRWAWNDIMIQLGQPYNPTSYGFSVRCLKD